jgi:hypothetical protein
MTNEEFERVQTQYLLEVCDFLGMYFTLSLIFFLTPQNRVTLINKVCHRALLSSRTDKLTPAQVHGVRRNELGRTSSSGQVSSVHVT